MPELKFYDIETIREKLNNITNYGDKVLYLINLKADFEQYIEKRKFDSESIPDEWKEKSQLTSTYENTLIRQIEIELERLKALEKIKNDSIKNSIVNLSINSSKDLDNRNYLDWTLYEFLDVVSEKPVVYTMHYKDDYEIDDDVFVGTKKQILEAIKEIPTDDLPESKTYLKEMIRTAESLDEFYSNVELTDIEKYNYLKKITDNFNQEQLSIVVQNVDLYLHSDFYERINEESFNIFLANGWVVPKYERETRIINGKSFDFNGIPNYSEMRKKTHKYAGFGLQSVIQILNSKRIIPDETDNNIPDFSKVSYSEKFVMLHQLGIIDYLKDKLKNQHDFIYSDIKLASLISSFTDMQNKQLRRDINAAFTGDLDHRNKITKNNIDKVKIKLHTLGIKPETFNIKP